MTNMFRRISSSIVSLFSSSPSDSSVQAISAGDDQPDALPTTDHYHDSITDINTAYEPILLPAPNLVGRRFENNRALRKYLRDFCRGDTNEHRGFVGYSICIRRSRGRGKYIRYICSRGRPRRNPSHNEQSQDIRQHRRRAPPLLCGCPFTIDAIRLGDEYTGVVTNPYHNHQPSRSMDMHASLRVPTLDDLETAEGLNLPQLLSLRPSDAQEALRQAFARPTLTRKDVYNLRPRLRRLFADA